MTRYWLAQVRHFHRDLLPNAEALRTPLVRAEAFRSLAGALLHCFPNTFLAQPATARQELLRADPAGGATVAAVAARWGFGHPGRFATAYRARFGEPPGTTLHR